MQSNKDKLQQVLIDVENDLKATGWNDDQIRKYIKRIIKDYFKQ